MTAYHLQLLRGNSAKQSAYTGREGELIYNTQLKNLWVHDGSTRGGKAIACVADIPTKMSQLVNDSHYVTSTEGGSAYSAVRDQLGNIINDYYAPKNSPALTGTPTSTTPAVGDNSTKIATTAWALKSTGIVHTTGNETINGTKTFTNTIDATALKAMWADLAENYKTDLIYPAGTLICFGGIMEITIAKDHVDGVISDKPGLVLNKTKKAGYQPVAMVGRTPIRVIGQVSKFDKIILSEHPGIGRAKQPFDEDRKVIGICLENDDDPGEKLVECVTNINLNDH